MVVGAHGLLGLRGQWIIVQPRNAGVQWLQFLYVIVEKLVKEIRFLAKSDSKHLEQPTRDLLRRVVVITQRFLEVGKLFFR